MMKIVVFLNAAHQRKYIDIVQSAMAGLSDVQVEAVDTSADDKPSDIERKALLKRLMNFRPFRLFLKFFLAIFYAPYAVFRKIAGLYRSHLHQYFRPLLDAAVHLAQEHKLKRRIRRLASPYRAPISRLRQKASRFRAVLYGLASTLRDRAHRALGQFWRQWVRPLLASLFRLLIGTLNYFRHRSILYAALSDRRWLRYLEDRLFSRQPDLIVLLEDNAEGLTGLVSHAARMRRIPYVILPDYIPNPAEPARYYFNNPLHSANTLAGRLVRFFAPRWILEYDGKQLLRLPGNAIFVRLMRGQRCPQPWILNAGYTEAIFLESKAALKHYEKLGFKTGKLKMIGGAVDDGLYAVHLERDAQRNALDEQYRLDPKKPLIVCGFPPDQYTAATEGFEFPTYEAMCRNWFGALEGVTDRANVLVVRHPRLKANILEPYAKGSVKIARGSLEIMLPVADLYVACISTTIRWALALAVPVINYDSYRYNYGDFSGAKGSIEVTSLDRFKAALDSVLLPGALDEIKAAARADSSNWGTIDGKFRSRLRNALLGSRKLYSGRPQSTHSGVYRLRKLD